MEPVSSTNYTRTSPSLSPHFSYSLHSIPIFPAPFPRPRHAPRSSCVGSCGQLRACHRPDGRSDRQRAVLLLCGRGRCRRESRCVQVVFPPRSIGSIHQASTLRFNQVDRSTSTTLSWTRTTRSCWRAPARDRVTTSSRRTRQVTARTLRSLAHSVISFLTAGRRVHLLL